MIRTENILPMVLTVIDIAAAVVYFYKGDIARGWYWLAAKNMEMAEKDKTYKAGEQLGLAI